MIICLQMIEGFYYESYINIYEKYLIRIYENYEYFSSIAMRRD